MSMGANSEDYDIVVCKRCGQPEYWGEMRWLSGHCVCRDCYKILYECTYRKPYAWGDLDGPRPSGYGDTNP